jgi:Domain of unknown function (DUF4403)
MVHPIETAWAIVVFTGSNGVFLHNSVSILLLFLRMKWKRILILPAIIFLVASCSHKINPEKPILSQTDFKLDSLPDSEINIPIHINLKPVYAMAEKSVDTVFTSPNYPEDWIQEGCSTRYKYIFRRSPLQMKVTGTSLNLGFMGYYKIVGATRVCMNGAVISPWTPACKCGFGSEGERRVNVSFASTMSIQPDYKVRLFVKRNEPEALDKCEVCFWGQDITKQVLDGLKTQLDAARDDMVASYGTVDLKSKFQMIWDQLNKVYHVYGLGWLQVNPQQIRINNLFAQNDSLNIYLGLSARPVISFEKPAEQNSWVPNIAEFSRRPGFNIFLDALLNYDSLSNILNQQVAGKQFDLNKGPVKKSFIIKDCKLIGSGNEKLIIKVNFSGTNDGVVYFVGKPVYNNETHIIEIKGMDFDIRSKNALLKAADWLFSKKITNEISRHARFDLSAYIDSAKVSINRQLNHEWIKGIHSYGSIDQINLIGIYPLSKYLVIRSNCVGDLSVKVESVNFSL